MSALRLARGFTGRKKVIKFDGCYHGHSDSLLVKAGSGLATFGVPDSSGVPEAFSGETIVLPLNDREVVRKTFQEIGQDIAAIIIEPVPANNGLLIQEPGYLEFLREITSEHGSLLIFDEVINGFRIGFSGSAGHFKIQPDILTYGKIIGGGMPVGAFAGRKEIFKHLAPDGSVYQAGTLSGNPVAMSAGLAQLTLLNDELYHKLETLGAHLEKKVNDAQLSWKIVRIGSIFWFYKGSTPPKSADVIDREAMKEYAAFHRFCLEKGVYLAPSGYEVGFLSSPMELRDVDLLADLSIQFFKK